MFDVGLLPLMLEGAGVIESRPMAISHPMELAQSDDLERDQLIQGYLKQIQAAGFTPERQGIWMQTGDGLRSPHRLWAANGGDKLHSGASLTKAATTLAVLHHYDPDHRFTTRVARTGEIENGVLKGNLIIEGGLDLLFMRPQAIALGNQLESMGIRKVAGDLILVFPYQNVLPEPEKLGVVLREGMNVGLWSEETLRHYQQHIPTAKKPSVSITGSIRTFLDPLSLSTELITHQSPPIIEMVKYMNLHSNNQLAESFVQEMGGKAVFLEMLLAASGLPRDEIQLKNGSGLGEENQMTPRAVVGIFIAIQARLEEFNLDLKDAFPVAGQDIGTLEDRTLPKGAVVKTGTLWNVSALAGYLPTQNKGRVWFAIMNEGGDYIDGFRQSQDKILTQIGQLFSN